MARAASARRHAQAAFEIALEQKELDRWRGDLKRISTVIKDPQLYSLLQSPKIHYEGKARVLADLLEGVTPMALNLACLLVAKSRLGIVEDMVAEYERMVDEYRGIAHAEVATAIPLEEKTKERLIDRLRDMVGREIVLTTKVEPALIGGLTVRMGDKFIDGSTKSRLNSLRESLVR